MMVEVIISFSLIFFLTCFVVCGVNAITAYDRKIRIVYMVWALASAVMCALVLILIPTWLEV